VVGLECLEVWDCPLSSLSLKEGEGVSNPLGVVLLLDSVGDGVEGEALRVGPECVIMEEAARILCATLEGFGTSHRAILCFHGGGDTGGGGASQEGCQAVC
jgi:hypothetical protein